MIDPELRTALNQIILDHYNGKQTILGALAEAYAMGARGAAAEEG